jgi:formyl-CoA transferase/CoA:oxalate CoA-transferase
MPGPLDKITVLDLTRNLAGPFCTMILADLGARVIKVERPGAGDDTRYWMPPRYGGESSIFLAINRSKEGLALDMDSEEGCAAIRRLFGHVDVVIETNRPGSMAKRGLGFDDARAVNPRIVYCSLSGFGADGPEAGRGGYDSIVQAASGVMSINGERERPPVRVGPSIIDMGTSMWATIAILSALRLRDATGEAQLAQTSLLECGLAWMSYYAAGFFGDGSVAGRHGSQHALMAPYENFETADVPIVVAALNDNLYRKLCETLGVADLADDPRFRSNSDRVAHRAELHHLLQAPLMTRPAAAWEAALSAQGVPCSMIKSVADALGSPQIAALGLVRSWPHPTLGEVKLVDHPVRYNGQRSFQHRQAPEIGEHSIRILEEIGYSRDEAAALSRSEVR